MDTPVIESILGTAEKIEFSVTKDYDKHPSVVTLLFRQATGITRGFKMLVDRYMHGQPKMSITCNKGKLDLRIEGRHPNDAIILRGLAYDETQLLHFARNEPEGRSLILTVGKLSDNGHILLSTKPIFSPLLLRGFEIAQD